MEISLGCVTSVSKAKLDCAWLRENNKVKSKVFSNQIEGWKALISWPQKNTQEGTDQLHFVMEATGVYHENFASWLYGQGASVSVVNPAYVKYYASGIGVRTKNDKKNSVVLALYGTKESPLLWQPAPLEVRTLKALLVRLDAVEKDLLRENNRLEKSTFTETPSAVLKSIELTIAFLKKERKNLEDLIEEHLNKHDKLKADNALLKTIPGVGPVIAQRMVMIVGGHQFNSASQCAAYLGLIPVEKESGSSIKGRSRLAKNGNPTIRAKLYMAAISAKQYNPDIKAQYESLIKKGKSKKSALGAAMRKLVQTLKIRETERSEVMIFSPQ
jgi:transposase